MVARRTRARCSTPSTPTSPENVRWCDRASGKSAADQLVDGCEVVGQDGGAVEISGQFLTGEEFTDDPIGIGRWILAGLRIGAEPCCE